jgi:hypothetical protein
MRCEMETEFRITLVVMSPSVRPLSGGYAHFVRQVS